MNGNQDGQKNIKILLKSVKEKMLRGSNKNSVEKEVAFARNVKNIVIAMDAQIKLMCVILCKENSMYREERYRDTVDYYIIKRKNKSTKKEEYLKGINLYGRDNEGILRVKEPKWIEQPIWKRKLPIDIATDFESAEKVLRGLKKYYNDSDYEYFIGKIVTDYIINEIK